MTGEESLRHAAMFGDAATVERLLDQGVNINAADNRGWTALLRATEKRHFAIAQRLIERGADVSLVDKRGRSALHWVAQFGDAEIAHLLLAHGAKGNALDVHSKTPVEQAILHRRNDILALLLQNIEWQQYTKNYYQEKALKLAIAKGNTRTVKILLEAGAKLNDSSLPYLSFSSPLIIAAKYHRVAIASLLIAYGANVNEKTIHRQSALSTCLSHPLPQNGVNGVKELLLRKGATIGLEEAIVSGDIVLAGQILTQGNVGIEMPDTSGRTLLQWATTYGTLDTVRLLAKYGANVNHTDHRQETPLMHASARGNLEMVKHLIVQGANPRQPAGKGLWTAFDFAAVNGHLEMATWLFEQFGFGTSQGGSILPAIAQNGHLSTLRFLLDKGIHPDETTNLYYGRTALMWAGCRGRADIARLLLERGADVNKRDGRGNTALCFAAASGTKTVTRLFLDHGADKESQELAITCALRAERPYMVDILSPT